MIEGERITIVTEETQKSVRESLCLSRVIPSIRFHPGFEVFTIRRSLYGIFYVCQEC